MVLNLLQEAGKCTSAAGTKLILTGSKLHNSIINGKRYHDTSPQIFNAVIDGYPNLVAENALQCVIKQINDTAGPGGLVPSLLVFGTIPTFPAIDIIPQTKGIVIVQ